MRGKSLSKCTLKGDSPSNLHLSTHEPKKDIVVSAPPMPQAPPQAEMLSEEYVRNLQQQLYMLNAELRFLQDRAGVGQDPDSCSVDSAIRGLRRACAMHEEETNQKAKEMQTQIEDLNKKCASIDISRSGEALRLANERENEGTSAIESAFVEVAGEAYAQGLKKASNESIASALSEQRSSLESAISSQKAIYNDAGAELAKVNADISTIKSNLKTSLDQLRDIAREGCLLEEEADIISLNEPSLQSANTPISSIEAKSAKVESELKSILSSRIQAEQTVDLLLEADIKVKAELNQARQDLQRAKNLKIVMDKEFSAKYSEEKAAVEEQRSELLSLKRTIKEQKQGVQKARSECVGMIDEINESQSRRQLLQTFVDLKAQEKIALDSENEKLRITLSQSEEEITRLRSDLNGLSKKIAEAMEEKRKAEFVVELNSKDPKCTLDRAHPELAQLLDSIHAMKKAIQ